MYETRSAKEVEADLSTSIESGLSEQEVSSRREKYGPNALEEKKKKGWFLTFLGEFKDPMVIVLAIAAIISLVLAITDQVTGDHSNADFFEVFEPYFEVIIIFAVVILNAVIGTVQEMKAEKALEALKEMSSPTATVRRDGKIVEIKASELVPGDIVILEEGRTVPADLRLIKSFSMKADESSLTGESVPAEKDADIVLSGEVGVGDRVNVVYMSTPIVYGRGEGIVIATGMNTEIGRIATMLSEGEEEMTPLQKQLAKLSKFLGYLTFGIVILMLGIRLLYSGISGHLAEQWMQDLLDSISLAVAAIPEGLPAVVTIVLALGMQKMAKVNTIVRRLASVETLGAVSYICSDKTGTLTENKMTVVGAYLPGKDVYERDDLEVGEMELLARGMALCSNASIENGVYGDPTEVALVAFADRLGMKKSALEAKFERVNEYPFDSVRKMMSTENKSEGKANYVYTKGAMDQVLKHCVSIVDYAGKSRAITKKDIDAAVEASNKMASKALRVLALAYKEVNPGSDEIEEENLTFVGLVGMVDPPRAAAKPAVATLKGAGITTVMITGDHVDTAHAIASELGIVTSREDCMSGDEIDACSEEELRKKVEHVRVFARVSPENKVQIVKAIKANGHLAAMTGDGVNDAPSLKAADIGIAMGITGTDVAKGAADMVLADDNFASIEKAVEEGRGIYTNIKKTILFLLSSNIGEVVCMFIAAIIGLDSPLIAIHLLWVNLVTDSLPAVALGSDKKPDDIMNEQPRDPGESVFSHGGWFVMFGYGIVIGLITLVAFLITPLTEGGTGLDVQAINAYFAANPEALSESQSMAFTVLAFSELFHMLGMTNLNRSFVYVFKDPNKLLWGSFIIGMGLQFFLLEVPGVNDFFSVHTLADRPIDYLWVFVLAVMPLVVHEISVLCMWIAKKVKASKQAA